MSQCEQTPAGRSGRTPTGGPRSGPGSSSQPDSDVPVTGRAEPGPPPPAANQAAALPQEAPAAATGPEEPEPVPDDRPRTAPARGADRPVIAPPGKADGEVDTRR